MKTCVKRWQETWTASADVLLSTVPFGRLEVYE